MTVYIFSKENMLFNQKPGDKASFISQLQEKQAESAKEQIFEGV